MPVDNTDINYNVFFYGLVGTGLLPAMKQYLLLARNLLKQRRDQLLTGEPLERTALTTGALAFVNKLGTSFLPAGLEELSARRAKENSDLMKSFSMLNLVATIVSVIALIFIYFFVYKPLFYTLDRDIKITRGLLLLLPEETARQVPAVLAVGDELLQEVFH